MTGGIDRPTASLRPPSLKAARERTEVSLSDTVAKVNPCAVGAPKEEGRLPGWLWVFGEHTGVNVNPGTTVASDEHARSSAAV